MTRWQPANHVEMSKTLKEGTSSTIVSLQHYSSLANVKHMHDYRPTSCATCNFSFVLARSSSLKSQENKKENFITWSRIIFFHVHNSLLISKWYAKISLNVTLGFKYQGPRVIMTWHTNLKVIPSILN